MPNVLLIESSYLDAKNVERQFLKNGITHIIHIASNGMEGLAKLKGTDGNKRINPTPRLILFSIHKSEMELISFVNLLRLDDLLDKFKIFVMVDSEQVRQKVKELNLKVSGCILKPLTFNKFFVRSASIDNFDLFLELVHGKSDNKNN